MRPPTLTTRNFHQDPCPAARTFPAPIPTDRATHWVVQFDSPRPAIPFGIFHAAYSLAKRATRDNHPAQAIEVYEEDGKFYDCNGNAVKVRGAA